MSGVPSFNNSNIITISKGGSGGGLNNTASHESKECTTVWLASFVTAVMVTVISVYITTSLIIYEILLQCKRRQERSSLLERRFSMIARILCILTGFSTVMVSSLHTVIALLESDSCLDVFHGTDMLCAIVSPMRNIFLVVTLTGVYSFLWLRQKVFYINEALRVLNSKKMFFISNFLLAFWMIFLVYSIVAYGVLINFKNSEIHGCMISASNGSGPFRQGHIIASVTSMIAIQICLLILFIYPLLRRSIISVRLHSQSSANGKRTGNCNTSLRRRVLRAVYCCALCVVTDIIASTATYFRGTSKTPPFRAYFMLDLLINLLCIIVCFDNWREMLIPCCAFKMKRNNSKRRQVLPSQTRSTEV